MKLQNEEKQKSKSKSKRKYIAKYTYNIYIIGKNKLR